MDKSLADLLEGLSQADIAKLLKTAASEGAVVKRPRTQTTVQHVSHEYHCEFCGSVKERSYPVNITSNAPRKHDPVILYTVCKGCKEAVVVGMAFALMLKRSEVRI